MNSHIKENNYKLCSWDCVHVPAHTSEYPCDKNGPILTHLSLLTTPQPSSHSSHTPHLHFPHSPTFPSLLTHPIPPLSTHPTPPLLTHHTLTSPHSSHPSSPSSTSLFSPLIHHPPLSPPSPPSHLIPFSLLPSLHDIIILQNLSAICFVGLDFFLLFPPNNISMCS